MKGRSSRTTVLQLDGAKLASLIPPGAYEIVRIDLSGGRQLALLEVQKIDSLGGTEEFFTIPAKPEQVFSLAKDMITPGKRTLSGHPSVTVSDKDTPKPPKPEKAKDEVVVLNPAPLVGTGPAEEVSKRKRRKRNPETGELE